MNSCRVNQSSSILGTAATKYSRYWCYIHVPTATTAVSSQQMSDAVVVKEEVAKVLKDVESVLAYINNLQATS